MGSPAPQTSIEAGNKPNRAWQKQFGGLLRGLLELCIHAIGLLAILGFFRLIEKTLEWLWGTQDVTFFGYVKVKYVFESVDLLMLVVFLILGTYRFLKAFYK